MKFYRTSLYSLLVWTALFNASNAQELEPRRWSHVPVDTSFFGVAYVRTEGDISFDPVLQIEDAKVRANSIIATYLRSFDWSGKSARIDIRIPYQQARWEGLLNGTPATVRREGLGDPRIRLSVNFIGAPALKGREFQEYRASQKSSTVAGAALAVTLPVGVYEEDKLLNLGQNRFIIRPQVGVVHTHGAWSFELTGSAFIYTENNEFWNGNKLEQEPLFAMQGHIIHGFHQGLWASISAGATRAGQSIVNGEKKEDRKEDFLYALSAGFPVSRTSSIKAAYARGRTRQNVGSDTDNFALAYIGLF